MTYFLLKDFIILPKKELHWSPRVCSDWLGPPRLELLMSDRSYLEVQGSLGDAYMVYVTYGIECMV